MYGSMQAFNYNEDTPEDTWMPLPVKKMTEERLRQVIRNKDDYDNYIKGIDWFYEVDLSSSKMSGTE